MTAEQETYLKSLYKHYEDKHAEVQPPETVIDDFVVLKDAIYYILTMYDDYLFGDAFVTELFEDNEIKILKDLKL